MGGLRKIMEKFYRIKLIDIVAIRTVTQLIKLGPGQTFYRTPKAIELWQDDPFRRLKRWSQEQVVWEYPRWW